MSSWFPDAAPVRKPARPPVAHKWCTHPPSRQRGSRGSSSYATRHCSVRRGLHVEFRPRSKHGVWPPRRRCRGRSVATARPPPPMHSLRPSWARTFWIDINVSPHAAPTGVRFNTCWVTGIIGQICALPSPCGIHKGRGASRPAPRPLSHSKVPTSMAPGHTPPSRHDKWARGGWPARPPLRCEWHWAGWRVDVPVSGDGG